MKAPLHNSVLDLHVTREVPLQGELAGAVEALEGFAVRVQVHVTHQVVHSVEFLPTQLLAHRGEEHSDFATEHQCVDPWGSEVRQPHLLLLRLNLSILNCFQGKWTPGS